MMKVIRFTKILSIAASVVLGLLSCNHNGFKNKSKKKGDGYTNVLFLHHSTGSRIYNGNKPDGEPLVKTWYAEYNKLHPKEGINFVEKSFPLSKHYKIIKGYGWANYPYDYYNIWVKNEEKESYKYEPTLSTLCTHWDVIILKHCYPVSAIQENGSPDINSSKKTIENYQLQYNALKKKMHEFPDTKFVVWTGAALTKQNTTQEQALRAKEFFTWVKEEWNEQGDNIYIWDFYELETEGGLYLLDEYAVSPVDSHPNMDFSAKVAPLFCKKIVEIVNF